MSPAASTARATSAAFLICDCCGAAEEFEPDFTAQLAAAAKAGYQVSADHPGSPRPLRRLPRRLGPSGSPPCPGPSWPGPST